MATQLLDRYETNISELTLIPSGGGVFEIMKNGKLIFSKKKLDRFPEEGEVISLIESF